MGQFLQSQAPNHRVGSSSESDRMHGSATKEPGVAGHHWPKFVYLLIFDTDTGVHLLRYLCETFAFWKCMTQLSEFHPGSSSCSVFFGAGSMITKAANACLAFSSSRKVQFVNTTRQLFLLSCLTSSQ